MEILTYPNDCLTVKCKVVQEAEIEEALQIANEMLDVLNDTPFGVGLSAPQVGCDKRIIVFTPSKGERFIMLNPTIVKRGKDTEAAKEGCLSFPDMEKEIERNTVIDVCWTDVNGGIKVETFKRWTARIIQHEIDHLDGILCMI